MTSFQYISDLASGILGYGSIGRQCAVLAKALGMEVYAYTSRERPDEASRKADNAYCVPGTGDPDGKIPTKWFHGASKASVNEFLAQDLDLLVICLPLTAATRHLIDAEQFKIMAKKSTFVSNVGRGPIVVTADLVEALEKGWIRGAALDVTDPEPLPDDHPLWKAPNIFITPHMSWSSDRVWHRVLDLMESNIERQANGEPLMNRLSKNL